MNGRKQILIFVDYYLPAFKAGGPIMSVSRLIERLKHEVDFYVFTRDRDLGDAEPFTEVPVNVWTEKDGVKVFYASPDRINANSIAHIVDELRPNVLYLNSYFSKMTRIVLAQRRLGNLGAAAITLAPRGEFSRGALKIKALKKSIYLGVAQVFGLHRGLWWQASTEHEETDIFREIEPLAHTILVAPDVMAPVDHDEALEAKCDKRPGEARFVFISRISPKKNLLGAIELLDGLKGEITFTIYGPKEDATYWQLCQEKIAQLPNNVRVIDGGSLLPQEVHARLAEEQFFLFPTFGENFGHVIAEALGAGCPALLSDTTPWLDLDERGAGWVIPLEETQRWRVTLQAAVDMDPEQYRSASAASVDVIRRRHEAEMASDANRRLFFLDAVR